jgi:hypothetical protein
MVRGKSILSCYDLKSAYNQCEVDARDRDLTTMICYEGTFRYRRVPFGLKSAVSYFTNELEKILRPIAVSTETKLIQSYLDDILVGSQNFETHLELTRDLLLCLRANRNRLALDKMEIGCTEVEYLGFRVSAEWWRPLETRVQALIDRKSPSNLKELRGALSAFSFYNRFMKGAATLLEPLMELLRGAIKGTPDGKKSKSKTKFEWNASCEQAFQKAKEILVSKVVLYHAKPEEDFYLFTDASNVATGSTLMQKFDGELRPVSFHSKVLTNAERNYTTTERECLAILHALKKHEALLIAGPKIYVLTDHRALLSLFTAKTNTTPRLER